MVMGENMCRCPNCACLTLPPEGAFTISKAYYWEYIIDGVKVYDDDQVGILLGASEFERYFQAFAFNIAVTTDVPMLRDKTIYSVFLLIEGEKCGIEEIKAYSRICRVNYVAARKALTQKRSFVTGGNAYRIRDIREILQQFKVNYEIEPPYPY